MTYGVVRMDVDVDRENILQFWRNNFPDRPKEKHSWFYQTNIYDKVECVSVQTVESNEIVGTATIFPRRMWVEGKALKGGIAGDLGVDKHHRVLGPAMKLLKSDILICQEGKFDFLYSYTNPVSKLVTKRAGFSLLGGAARLVKIFKTSEYIHRRLKNKTLSGLVSIPIDIGLRAVAKENLIKTKGFRYDVVDYCDSNFDTLWEHSRQNFPIIGDRSSKFLNWRFHQCPYRKYHTFALYDNDNTIIGYIVYYLTASDARIVDMLALDNDTSLDMLLASFLKMARILGCHSVSTVFFGNFKIIARFIKYGFTLREDTSTMVVYTKPESDFNGCIQDPDNWYFFEADMD